MQGSITGRTVMFLANYSAWGIPPGVLPPSGETFPRGILRAGEAMHGFPIFQKGFWRQKIGTSGFWPEPGLFLASRMPSEGQRGIPLGEAAGAGWGGKWVVALPPPGICPC